MIIETVGEILEYKAKMDNFPTVKVKVSPDTRDIILDFVIIDVNYTKRFTEKLHNYFINTIIINVDIDNERILRSTIKLPSELTYFNNNCVKTYVSKIHVIRKL